MQKLTFYFCLLPLFLPAFHLGEPLWGGDTEGREINKSKRAEEHHTEMPRWKGFTVATVVGAAAWLTQKGKGYKDVQEDMPVTNLNFVEASWFEQEPQIDFSKGVGEQVCAALIPHAGYRYSGKVSAEILSWVDWRKYDTVIILSTAHTSSVNCQLPRDIEAINLPNHVGSIAIAHIPSLAFTEDQKALEKEHAWQMSLLLHQVNTYRSDQEQSPIKIVPLLIANHDDSTEKAIKQYCLEHPQTFLLVNTDLLHCEEDCPSDPKDFDKKTVENIKKAIHTGTGLIYKPEGQGTMCGIHAVRLFAKLAYQRRLKAATTLHTSSLEATPQAGGKYVGYLGLTLVPIEQPKASDKNLIKLPKQVLEEQKKHLGQQVSSDKIAKLAALYHDSGALFDPKTSGIFVTIYKNKTLRGCLGTFALQDPDMGTAIARQTLASALSDSRFDPIREEELPQLSFEITLLEKPFIIYKKGYLKTPLEAFKQHYKEGHGITITFNNGNSATFLSSVLEEMPAGLEAKFEKVVANLRVKSGTHEKVPIKAIELYVCRLLR